MLRYLKRRIPFETLCVVLAAVRGVAMVSISLYVAYVTDALTVGKQADIPLLLAQSAAVIAAIVLVEYLASWSRYRWSMGIQRDVESDLAFALLRKRPEPFFVQNLYANEIKELMSRYFLNLWQAFVTICSFVAAVSYGSSLSVSTVAISVALVLLSIGVTQFFSNRLSANMNRLQESNTRLGAVVKKVYSCLLDIKIYGAYDLGERLTQRAIDERIRAATACERYSTGVEAVNTVCSLLIQLGTILMALINCYLGNITFGDAMAIMLLIQYIVGPLNRMISIKNAIDSTKGIRQKFCGLLSLPKALPAPRAGVGGDITLENVRFRYDEKPFIEGLDLTFERGKKYLVVGKSGSGKSTVMRLILGLLEPQAGRVAYGGTDIRGLSPEDIYADIGYVGQDIALLPSTIRQNISLSVKSDDARVRSALTRVNLESLISRLDEEADENLSGGERQRVAIARLIYSDCGVCLFDEFTSALDHKNATALERYALGLEGRTVIHISHHFDRDLIGLYDEVVVLEAGRVTFKGHADSADTIASCYAMP